MTKADEVLAEILERHISGVEPATFELTGNWLVVRTSPLPDTIAEALEHSIHKWEFIEECMVKDKDLLPSCGGGWSCALCCVAKDCYECPVGIAGHRGCKDTPYREFRSANNHEEALEACRAEIAFLKSLRTDDGDPMEDA